MRLWKKAGALLLLAGILLGIPAAAQAEDISYTYNYDYWGDVQDCPDLYTVSKVFTSADLGLETRMNNPQGLYVSGDLIYVCDTGNNRILEIRRHSAENLEIVRIIDSFTGDVENTSFLAPTDVAVSEAGNFFIADKGNARILKLDPDLHYLMQFDKPVDNTLDPAIAFQPDKIAVDSAERVYCVATGINKGLVKYENDGVFSGFVGATKVTFDFMDYLWKRFATQAQRAQMESFVPTEYDNLYRDYE